MTAPELELMLLLARTEDARAAAVPRIRQLAGTVDHARLEVALRKRLLLPLLGGRLAELAPHGVPAAFPAAVHAERNRYRVLGLTLQLQAEGAVGTLAEAGVRALALKGPALAEAAHGDLGLRASDDVDLLVGEADLPRAVAALRAEGYAAPHDTTGADGLPALHFQLTHPERAPVELHWRIHWYERRFAADLLARCAPQDTAAALLLFYARDGFLGLRFASDLAGWWDRHGSAVPPGSLAAHLDRYPELAQAWLAAAAMAEVVAAVPARAWFGGRGPGRRGRLAMRLGNWSQSGTRDQLLANLTVVDALLAPRGGLPAVAGRALDRAPESRAAHAVKLSARAGIGLAGALTRGWGRLP